MSDQAGVVPGFCHLCLQPKTALGVLKPVGLSVRNPCMHPVVTRILRIHTTTEAETQ